MTSTLEEAFALYLRLLQPELPAPNREWLFARPRRFRFDFAWPAARVAVELQGGVWTRGRHVRGSGYQRDCEKLNLAAAKGWRVFYLTKQMLDDDPHMWLDVIAEAVQWRL